MYGRNTQVLLCWFYVLCTVLHAATNINKNASNTPGHRSMAKLKISENIGLSSSPYTQIQPQKRSAKDGISRQTIRLIKRSAPDMEFEENDLMGFSYTPNNAGWYSLNKKNSVEPRQSYRLMKKPDSRQVLRLSKKSVQDDSPEFGKRSGQVLRLLKKDSPALVEDKDEKRSQALRLMKKDQTLRLMKRDQSLRLMKKDQSLRLMKKDMALRLMKKDQTLRLMKKDQFPELAKKDQTLRLMKKDQTLRLMKKDQALRIMKRDQALRLLKRDQMVRLMKRDKELGITSSSFNDSHDINQAIRLLSENEEKRTIQALRLMKRANENSMQRRSNYKNQTLRLRKKAGIIPTLVQSAGVRLSKREVENLITKEQIQHLLSSKRDIRTLRDIRVV
ncbi:uncharacterized protein LOC111698839 isoform X2 [Eurytemora carolleeae]|uniref:uncharacterized protein LOC111698839 isoform X2 n=1 Tax=Eurytemora carolleeae TaxID=1294199 RepID=UPI000C779139|nr:uncharacterized protein LOC111698839 isoform X2 [Eurytemora carolleeae]|eukprot:XP_023325059.1 uncharacterized protein LOC111698839 isoform X2 [Eurytemora affinis]